MRFHMHAKEFALASLNDAVMYFGARPANGSIQVDLFEAKLREKERAGCHCRWCALHFSNDCLHYVSVGVPLSAAGTLSERYINYPRDEYSERLAGALAKFSHRMKLSRLRHTILDVNRPSVHSSVFRAAQPIQAIINNWIL